MASKIALTMRTVLAQNWPLPIYDIKGNFEFDKIEMRLDCKGRKWAQDRFLTLTFDCPDFLDDAAILHNALSAVAQIKAMVEKHENPAAMAERIASRLTPGETVNVIELQRIISEELGC